MSVRESYFRVDMTLSDSQLKVAKDLLQKLDDGWEPEVADNKFLMVLNGPVMNITADSDNGRDHPASVASFVERLLKDPTSVEEEVTFQWVDVLDDRVTAGAYRVNKRVKELMHLSDWEEGKF